MAPSTKASACYPCGELKSDTRPTISPVQPRRAAMVLCYDRLPALGINIYTCHFETSGEPIVRSRAQPGFEHTWIMPSPLPRLLARTCGVRPHVGLAAQGGRQFPIAGEARIQRTVHRHPLRSSSSGLEDACVPIRCQPRSQVQVLGPVPRHGPRSPFFIRTLEVGGFALVLVCSWVSELRPRTAGQNRVRGRYPRPRSPCLIHRRPARRQVRTSPSAP